MKRVLLLLLTLVMLLSLAPWAAASTGFSDVKETDYCAQAVTWAVNRGITTGTSATTFSPDLICSREEALTLLWRANGSSPLEQEYSQPLPFQDVDAERYSYPAISWAWGCQLLEGGEKLYPQSPCTRAMFLTFLWSRYTRNWHYDGQGPLFDDVASDSPYVDAVDWAVSSGITTGTGNNLFSPERSCTRGEIVTFLYRTLG